MIRKQTKFRRNRIQELIEILRNRSHLFLDSREGEILSKFADAGVFRLGGTLIGTTAFLCYENILGVRTDSEELVKTKDIDIAGFRRLSIVINDTVSPNLQDILREMSLKEVPSLDGNKVSKWTNQQIDLSVEFLTPSFSDRLGYQSLPSLGVHGQEIHYLNFLLRQPIHSVLLYGNGVLVRIPQPERFAVHKLIVAEDRRDGPDSDKSAKDRLQSSWLIKILAASNPTGLFQAYEEARNEGPKWARHLNNSMKRETEISEIFNEVRNQLKESQRKRNQ